MEIIRKSDSVRMLIRHLKKAGKSIGFVPTMGALHNGHLSLVQLAKSKADITVVSIFVNPLQFAPHEDFDSYPRTEQTDIDLCRKAGVDILFIPESSEINSRSDSFQINVGNLGAILDGITRPHFFGGVATIVAKLFNIVEPDFAVFGQKDLQQSLIIKKLVRDLNYGIDIITGPIVRESNGLAMSSRNKYLSPEEKESAGVIFTTLQKGSEVIGKGILDRKLINAEMIKHLREFSNLSIDYVSSNSATDLSAPDSFIPGEKVALLIAVYSGKTRLIDNTIVTAPTNGLGLSEGKKFSEASDVWKNI